MEIELVNYFIKGNIELTKVDENKLSGAVFEVYSDTNGDGKLDEDDVLLGAMTESDDGYGNIVQTDTTVTQIYLYITVISP